VTSPSPRLYLICGLPGSGKTTTAKRLEQEKQALRLSPDEWISPILKDPQDLVELSRLRSPIEALQWDVVKRVLQLGANVILENGFWLRRERLDYLSQGKALGAEVELYYCEASLPELWQRISKRNNNLPEATFSVTKEQLELWHSWFEAPQEDEFALYTAGHKIS
jgi:predicted kinase